MRINRMSRAGSALLFGSLLLGFAMTSALAAEVVIANSSVGAAQVDKGTLQSLFLGKTSRLGDAGVTVATLQQGAVHDAFLQAYVGRSPQQFLSHWRKLVFSGQGTQPPAFASEQEMVEFVAKTPGAVGYISDATPHDGVKVLGVN